MDKHEEDDVIILALMKRFTEHRLPRALELEKRVMAGEKLNNSDISFLSQVLNDAQYVMRLSDKYPEYQEIVSKAVQLYSDITKKALENENKEKD